MDKPLDLYRVAAANYYGVPYDQVTEVQRRAAKRGAAMALYGATQSAIRRELDAVSVAALPLADAVPGASHR